MRHALIMAAGRGSRMKPLTDIVPKPMAQIGNLTLLEIGINNIKKFIDSIHITVGYKGSLLAKHAIECGVNSIINTTDQESSWWIYNSVASNIDDNILVMTCDNLFVIDIDSLFEEYISLDKPACMIVPTNKIAGFEGDFIHYDSSQNVVKINRVDETDIICSGLQIINPVKINFLAPNCNNFYEIWHKLLNFNELKVANIRPKDWVAIDTIQQLENYIAKTI
jgi:NDP-sugar pyrophosphorylase family protein